MADIKHMRGLKLLLKVGNGASPEVFTAKCSINAERGISFKAGTNDNEVIDCADPEALAWLLREKTNLSCDITGAGTLNTPDVQEFFDWTTSPDAKNCQFIVDVPAADGGVIFLGAFHLTQFDITGAKGAKTQVSIALNSDGEVTCEDND